MDTPYIVEGLRPLAVPLADLVPDPSNVRQHSERNLLGIMGSLQKYGQRVALVVNRKNNVIEKGNGTFAAAQRLGWEAIAVVYVEDDPITATGFSIADNRLAELAEWDFEGLSGLLKGLDAEGEDLTLLGWSDDDLRNILNAGFESPSLTDLPLDDSSEPELGRPLSLTDEQREVVDRAIAQMRSEAEDRHMSEGRAIELICADYLSGR